MLRLPTLWNTIFACAVTDTTPGTQTETLYRSDVEENERLEEQIRVQLRLIARCGDMVWIERE